MSKVIHYKEYDKPVFFRDKYFETIEDLLDRYSIDVVAEGVVTGSKRVNLEDDALEFIDNALQHHFDEYSFEEVEDARPCAFIDNDAIGEFKAFYDQWVKKHKPGFWGEDTDLVIEFTEEQEVTR